ncbi:DUF4349 domain-containing protein [Nocardioides ferulae]|uniref:DUF4349 domain-containing protein n=1 Tax=Nocardioides ferulae TaxID=2340821 RepID=UPI0013DE3FC2|nr:DUF4349 domain-containing protein [Nocardioides ferulae]
MPRRLPALAAALLAVTLTAGACSSSDDGGDSQATAADSAAEGGAMSAEDAPADSVLRDQPGKAAPEQQVQEALVIRTGTVSLESDDVAQARFDVQKVVDRAGGQITDEETRTGDDGEVRTSRMVLRVPSDTFEATMKELEEEVAELNDSTRSSEDVTTQVIDNRVRIRVQRASIRRIEALLARAVDIGDVVRIESELSQRQSELNSLLRRRAFLTDQTSMSTITVHLERTSEQQAEDEEEDDDAGFLSGLDAGWGALTAFTVALVTVVGALLPWLGVLLAIAVPLWWLRRNRRRRRPAAPTAEA